MTSVESKVTKVLKSLEEEHISRQHRLCLQLQSSFLLKHYGLLRTAFLSDHRLGYWVQLSVFK